MGKLKAPQQKELSHIPIPEFVSNSTQQRLEEDVCRNLDKVERHICPLIKRAPTRLTPKPVIAQAGFTLQWGNVRRLAMGAMHRK